MEITYAETAWHVFSAFAIFLCGLVVFALKLFRAVSTKMQVALYLWHTCFCLYYARFALHNTADARGYFVRSFDTAPSLSLGTSAVDFITSIYTQFFGLSYLGTFLVYNIIGAIGLLALAAALHEVLGTKSQRTRLYAMVILFLPGINFWSVAIGKDAPALLGTGLMCWAVLNFSRRWIVFLLGIATFLVVRPHIVGIIFPAIALAMLVSGKLNVVRKAFVVMILVVPSAFAIQLALSTIGMGQTKAFSDIGGFIEYRQLVNLEGGSSVDISGMVLPLQMFHVAFMPIIIGASGSMGLVASVENLFLLILVATSAFSVWKRKSSLPSVAKWFFLFYGFGLWIILAMTTANLGLALRQKWMFMPILLLFCLSYLRDRRLISFSSLSPRENAPLGTTEEGGVRGRLGGDAVSPKEA